MKTKLLILIASIAMWWGVAVAQSSFGNVPATVSVNDVTVTGEYDLVYHMRRESALNPATGRMETVRYPDSVMSIPSDQFDTWAPARLRRRAQASTDFEDTGWAFSTSSRVLTYNYPSIDADGNPIILSSALCASRGNSKAKSKLIIGCHVTITSNKECPTEYNKSASILAFKSDVGMLYYHAKYDDEVVILPDYEGYGLTSSRPHPYLYQELTARQVVDAVRYGKALYDAMADNDEWMRFASDWHSVSIGYSQGGSVSLATHRFIEENGLDSELRFAGSVCGDGPYDPVAHLQYYMTDNGNAYDGSNTTNHTRGKIAMPVVLPLILKGMCDRNPYMKQHVIGNYLSTMFLDTGIIDWLNAKSKEAGEQYTTSDVNDALDKMRKNGFTNNGRSYTAAQVQQMLVDKVDDNVVGDTRYMFTTTCYNYFNTASNFTSVPTTRGMMQDLHRALASNSMVHGWSPRHRVAFFHSTYDTVVPYENLRSFISNHKNLVYYGDTRSGISGVSRTSDPAAADVYIIDNQCTDDHVSAGTKFYFSAFGTSIENQLEAWILAGQ